METGNEEFGERFRTDDHSILVAAKTELVGGGDLCGTSGNAGVADHNRSVGVAEKLCDKVAIIKQGKLIKAGTMEEVKGDESLEEVFLELEAE